MADIVDRLRETFGDEPWDLLDDTISEIQRLRAAVRRAHKFFDGMDMELERELKAALSENSP